MWGFAPALTRLGRDMGFVPFVITSCIVLYAATILVDRRNIGGLFDLLSPTNTGLFLFGASGRIPVVSYGRWWTLLTASWLHANLIHILLNMMSVRNVAPIVAEFYGASRMIIIYVISGVVGFALSTFAGTYLQFIPFLTGAGFTVGALSVNRRLDWRRLFLWAPNRQQRRRGTGQDVDHDVSGHGLPVSWDR